MTTEVEVVIGYAFIITAKLVLGAARPVAAEHPFGAFGLVYAGPIGT
jgi:hypothetical protein